MKLRVSLKCVSVHLWCTVDACSMLSLSLDESTSNFEVVSFKVTFTHDVHVWTLYLMF